LSNTPCADIAGAQRPSPNFFAETRVEPREHLRGELTRPASRPSDWLNSGAGMKPWSAVSTAR
jgi:hypothetical protein